MKALSLGVWLVLLPALAGAQVVVHQAALDQLAGIAPAAPVAKAAAPPAIHHVARRIVHRRIATPTAVAFQAPPPLSDLTPHPPPAVLPAAARAPAPAPPSAPGPATAAPVARPVPVVVKPVLPRVVALRFAAGSAELPAGAAATLKPICTAAEPAGTIDVQAAAPASPGDPSIGMRLSMQRAFAVRDALAACGISPARIVPQATGASGGGDLDTARISLGAP